jgi:pimeloyl-ACP methyl ester carboxylesterase
MSIYTEITLTIDDGLRLYARDYAGSGGPARLPVICIHGLTRNASDFDELAPVLAGMGRRVLALDVRGRGRSGRDPAPHRYTQQVYAGDVAQLMSDLGIARAVFVGTSMGGLITMTLAEQRLDLVAAVILNDIGPVLSEKGLARIVSYVGKTDPQPSWEAAAQSVREIHACAFPGYGAADWDKWARRAFEPDDGGRLVPRYDPAIAEALRDGKLRPTSPEIQAAFRRLAQARPTLLIHGALSDLIEAEQVDWMRREAPSMQYVEVPDVGHAPMLNEPAALDAIRRFLDTVP